MTDVLHIMLEILRCIPQLAQGRRHHRVARV